MFLTQRRDATRMLPGYGHHDRQVRARFDNELIHNSLHFIVMRIGRNRPVVRLDRSEQGHRVSRGSADMRGWPMQRPGPIGRVPPEKCETRLIRSGHAAKVTAI
jgi:hypothetical protein